MRTRAHNPPPVSSARSRTTRNSIASSPPGKSSAQTPRKITRSFSNISGGTATALSNRNSNGEVQIFREGNIIIISGVDPEALQLYEYQDHVRKPARSEHEHAYISQNDRRTTRRESLQAAISTSTLTSQNEHSKTKSTLEDNHDRPTRAKHSKRPPSDSENEDDADAEGEAVSDDSAQKTSNGDDDYPDRALPPPKSAVLIVPKRGGVVKRKRRGGTQVGSRVPSREPTPPPEMLPPEEDVLSDYELPSPFTDEPFDDPNLPDDEAQTLYLKLYQPMTRAALFVDSLTKYDPAIRNTENLYALAANTAAALRTWQDEYLQLEKITAPHAAIPRKPATGQRNRIDPMIYEDQKEADLYDYIYDAKKIGFQNPLAQRVVRDSSGRELRTRQPRGQSGISTANVVAEDTAVGRRARKPITRFDGAQSGAAGGTRKRVLEASETPEVEQQQQPAAKRGRTTARGRGGRGGRGGGRGGLLGKRIQEMRAESVVSSPAPPSDADEGEFSGSEGGRSSIPPPSRREESIAAEDPSSVPGTPAPELSQDQNDNGEEEGEGGFSADGVALTASGKRKGRPKGSKNHHKRSDAGIPKGPRQPKINLGPGSGPTSGSPLAAAGSPDELTPSVTPVATVPGSGDPKKKAPRSEKRSQSMVEWWAKRKAKAAEEKAAQKAREQAEQAGRQRAHAVAMQSAQSQASHLGLPTLRHTHHATTAPPPLPLHQYAPQYQHQQHPGQGGYVSPFGPPPGQQQQHQPHQQQQQQQQQHQAHQQQQQQQTGPPPRPSLPGSTGGPLQAQGHTEYRSPFPPTSAHPGFPHAAYSLPPTTSSSGVVTTSSSGPLPPPSGPLAPHNGAGTSLPSLGQTIGHGPWGAYAGGPPPPPQHHAGISQQQQQQQQRNHMQQQQHHQQQQQYHQQQQALGPGGYLSQQQQQQQQQGQQQQQQHQGGPQGQGTIQQPGGGVGNGNGNGRDQHGFVRTF